MSYAAIVDSNKRVRVVPDDLDRSRRGEIEQEPIAELSAQRAQRLAAVGEMTGGIAHDFRNILSVIDAGLCLLAKHSDDPTKRTTFIDAARTGVNRGQELTSQLLSLTTKSEPSPCPNNANDVLQTLDSLLEYGAGPTIHVLRSLASDLPQCLLDPAEFTSAILNLVINARDAMPHGGLIQISTAYVVVEAGGPGTPPAGPYVKVSVADTGHGMAENVQRKIFDSFFTTKGNKGTGLGLPQIYASMKRVGGYVSVTSEPQRGTTFELLFPVVAAGGRNADEVLEHAFTSPQR